jgi:RNA polymerase subunit RPABC4/transcription elongation factor Spt4
VLSTRGIKWSRSSSRAPNEERRLLMLNHAEERMMEANKCECGQRMPLPENHGKYCPECGTKVPTMEEMQTAPRVACRSCNAMIEPRTNFCRECGEHGTSQLAEIDEMMARLKSGPDSQAEQFARSVLFELVATSNHASLWTLLRPVRASFAQRLQDET